MTELWRPSPARIADANLTRFIKCLNARRGMRIEDYDALYAWSLALAAGVLERAGTLRRRARRLGQRPGAREPARHARRALLSRRAAEFRREPAALRRRPAGAGVPQRARRAPYALLPRAARGSGAHRRRAARRGSGARRPRRGLPAEPARSGDRDAGHGQPRAPSGPPARRTSACTACSTASGRSHRRCCSPPTAISTPARTSTRCEPIAAVLAEADLGRARGGDPLRAPAAAARAPRRRGRARHAVAGVRHARRAAQLRAAAVRPPALHPVFLRHHRRAEVHRARRRRHAAAAPEGTPAAHRPAARATACSTSPPAAG